MRKSRIYPRYARQSSTIFFHRPWKTGHAGRCTRAYESAIRQVVRPGSVVVDIGTGSGILALMACRSGARKVFAIEPADVIQLAREIARANGYADRIEFIQSHSTAATLPERA